MNKVVISQYRWAGKWGPFEIKTVCEECELSQLVIGDLIREKFPHGDVTFEVKEWLPNWWRVIWKGGWHAPIFLVNGHLCMQGKTVDLKKLEEMVKKELNS
jgi:hypothetical protein